MTNVTMPEPVAFLVNGKMLFDEIYSTRQQAERVMKSRATSFDGEDDPKLTTLITTDQAEAYADTRVREALEEAAHLCETHWQQFSESDVRRFMHKLPGKVYASAIRALIPKVPPCET